MRASSQQFMIFDYQQNMLKTLRMAPTPTGIH